MRPAKMSGEHIWSKWLQKVFGKQTYNFRRIEHDAANVPRISAQWRAPFVDIKAHEVCEQCNNQWMSALENATKAVTEEMIVNGRSVSLPPNGIVTIAAFAFKTAVVVDHMNMRAARRPFAGSFFEPATRQRFRRSLALPEDIHIWLAEFRSKASAAGCLRSYYFKNKTGPWKDFHFFVVTYVVGHLIFQIVCPRCAKIYRPRLPFPPLAQEPKWDAASVLMWPNYGFPVSWPPPQYFGDDSIDTFSYRW
jgi:hypothetical protein